ncbi:ATP-dependent zinc metalloprotease FTSH 12, chloroplastic-like isoform X2 [Carica papaya]|uniref:ATP-dependent zinc metalloprotease FTSH 12, chloroplastic-like isoform X2 n=1 Tax=Carica papaya TaxID=3649 RepID=UPI000B8CE908|nr:ATP-dependent zinc metalloprotease FTSH 12, chloroplastic-like isoform X2 [Carica papaya]
MDIVVSSRPPPFIFSSTSLRRKPLAFTPYQLPLRRRRGNAPKKIIFRIHSSANQGGVDGFSWPSLAASFRHGVERFWLKLRESVKKETGFDLEEANVKVDKSMQEFVNWNRWERWKVQEEYMEEDNPQGPEVEEIC